MFVVLTDGEHQKAATRIVLADLSPMATEATVQMVTRGSNNSNAQEKRTADDSIKATRKRSLPRLSRGNTNGKMLSYFLFW